MMVGVSMALSIAITIAAFIWLYVQIGPFLSDFIPQDSAAGEPVQTGPGFTFGTDLTPTPEGEADEPDAPMVNPTPDDTDADADATDVAAITPEAEPEWQPTHQIRPGPNVNFRSGPNTISPTQGALAPGTPLRYLDESQPAGGVTWMFFEVEDGTEGWIRDIDVDEIEPADS
jgi:hypothetical protein